MMPPEKNVISKVKVVKTNKLYQILPVKVPLAMITLFGFQFLFIRILFLKCEKATKDITQKSTLMN